MLSIKNIEDWKSCLHLFGGLAAQAGLSEQSLRSLNFDEFGGLLEGYIDNDFYTVLARFCAAVEVCRHDHSQCAVIAYLDVFGEITLPEFEASHQGAYRTALSYGEVYMNERFNVRTGWGPYIDYGKVVTDLFRSQYTFHNGHVFRNRH